MRKEIEPLDPQEAESMFGIETTWERRGRIEGKIEGRLEGKMEGMIEVARRMLAQGISIQDVIRWTGLTKEHIKN